MHVDEKETTPAVTPTEPVSEPLKNLATTESEPLSKDEADEIFFHAVSEIPTQPLPKRSTREETHALIFLYVLVLSFIAGSLIGILTYPTVTIDLVPISKHAVFTTLLEIPTRTLPPVTLSKSLTATTTGKGHQDERAATGTGHLLRRGCSGRAPRGRALRPARGCRPGPASEGPRSAGAARGRAWRSSRRSRC